MTWGLVFFGVAAMCAVVGFITMYTYSESSYGTGHIVGGDAYNYIIIAVRGVAWLVAGLIATVTGASLCILAAMKNDRLNPSPQLPEAPYARRHQEEVSGHAERAPDEDPRANDLRRP